MDISERSVADFLGALLDQTDLDGEAGEIAAEFGFSGWRSFLESGILSWNEGLVMRFKDGSEYQVSVVCLRLAH